MATGRMRESVRDLLELCLSLKRSVNYKARGDNGYTSALVAYVGDEIVVFELTDRWYVESLSEITSIKIEKTSAMSPDFARWVEARQKSQTPEKVLR